MICMQRNIMCYELLIRRATLYTHTRRSGQRMAGDMVQAWQDFQCKSVSTFKCIAEGYIISN